MLTIEWFKRVVSVSLLTHTVSLIKVLNGYLGETKTLKHHTTVGQEKASLFLASRVGCGYSSFLKSLCDLKR